MHKAATNEVPLVTLKRYLIRDFSRETTNLPLLRAQDRLIYFAHVPKCAGSAVEKYLSLRFGPVAFLDTKHLLQAGPKRWSATSPQHISRDALDRLFPANFFDASFAVVRHPVARIVSAWHFQLEVERSIPNGVRFSDWLSDLVDLRDEAPFAYDNHIRTMDDIVPADAKVFYQEHGLDAIVPWLDQLLGDQSGPRSIGEINRRGSITKSSARKIEPSKSDLEIIQDSFAVDFDRFGYRLDDPVPTAPAPVLPASYMDARDTERSNATRSINRVLNKVQSLFPKQS